MGPWYSIKSSIMSPEIIFKTSQKHPKLQFVAKCKEIASKTCKSSGNYKNVWVGGGGALADQEMGPWWSINSSIMSPEINFKCSQKQSKLQFPRSPHIHNHMDINIQL